MKLKQFGPWGGRRPKFYHVDPSLPCTHTLFDGIFVMILSRTHEEKL